LRVIMQFLNKILLTAEKNTHTCGEFLWVRY
jgi:hypothetical protein